MSKRPIAILAVAACALLALAAAAYWPGLYGGFLFDDFANLPALGSSGPIDNWPAFWRYVTSGFNDPFGRPLTLLTFLLDARDWPADPFPFKRTSLVLHLVNGVLLGLLLRRLGGALFDIGTHPAKAAPAFGLEPPYGEATEHDEAPVYGGRPVHGADPTPAAAHARRADQGAPATDPPGEAARATHGAARAVPAFGLEPPYGEGPAHGGEDPAHGGHPMHGAGPTPAAARARRADQGAPATDPPGEAAHPSHRASRADPPGNAAPADEGVLAWRINLAALLGAALWLLHPLFVSTTLYIVQREAMLPATFILLGLLAWLHGRGRLRAGHVRRGIVWACVGLGGCTLLATFAKANGALLPLLALAIEATVLTRRPFAPGAGRRAHRVLLALLATLPSAALVAHVVQVGVAGILSGATGVRTWTIGQRLLTEPRVLWDYLSLLWLPRPFSHGLFNDQFAASTSLLHPATTLPALAGVLALIGGAWWLRRRQPALALAALFYFGGQLIESSSLPLELYFEHRNYVPALVMFWPLALWLADTRRLKAPKLALMFILPLGLALMTHARADLWGNAQAQTLLWAHNNPASPRAQAGAAQMEITTGHPERALRRLAPLLAAEPDQVQLAFNGLAARCALGGVTPGDIATASRAMRTAALTGTLLTSWFDRTLPTVMAGGCPGLDLAGMQSLIDAGLHNPRFASAGPQQDLHYLRGRVALLEHRPDAALADFTRALDLNVRPAMALQSAATLGSAGYPALGLKLLDHYRQVAGLAPPPGPGMPRVHAWVLARQGYWAHELAHLRGQLELDAAGDRPNTARSSH